MSDNALPHCVVAKPFQNTTVVPLPPQPPPPNAVLCEPPSIRLTVAMVTITTPWRQQWEADWEGGEGKAALRDERKMMAGRGRGWLVQRKEWRKC